MTDQSSCSVDSEELSAFMDEELPDQRMTALREHVRECASCTERLSRLRETQRVSRLADAPDAPDSFVSDVRDRIEADTGTEAVSGGSSDTTGVHDASSGVPSGDDEKRSLFPSPVSRAAAAVLLVGISVGLLLFLWPTGQSPERSADQQITMEVPETNEGAEKESSQETKNATVGPEPEIERLEQETPSSTAGTGQGASEPEQTASKTDDAMKKELKQTADRGGVDRTSSEQNESQKQRSMTEAPSAAAGGFGNTVKRTSGPVYVRLTGDLRDVPDQLTAALEAMDPERVMVRVTRTDTGKEQPSSGFAGAGSTDARRLALDAGVKQIAQVLNSDVRLELVMPETEAMLFLGALVQQGRSPRIRAADDVRSPETSTVADADEPKADSSASVESQSGNETPGEKRKDSDDRSGENMMVSLQRVNVQLQASRSAWVQEQKTADAGSAATNGSISIPALRRFLNDYREDEDRTTASSTDRAQKQAGSGGETDAAARRVVLQEWIDLLERRPTSWSATAEKQADQTPSGTRSLEQDSSRDVPDHVDVILYVQPSGEPVEQAAPSTLQQEEDE